MSLSERQRKFARMVGHLILWATEHGYELTFGDAYRDPRCPYGSTQSKHHSRLAVDLNLFVDGVYRPDTDAYTPLGEYWESIGGVWGGRFDGPGGAPTGDGNHFEIG